MGQVKHKQLLVVIKVFSDLWHILN